jgi:hypothetical protein
MTSRSSVVAYVLVIAAIIVAAVVATIWLGQ